MQTFDECVLSKQSDCDPKNMWLQIPFFCGHAAECWYVKLSLKPQNICSFNKFIKFFFVFCREPGSEWALNQAKYNLVNEYFLVGVTEQMEDFVDLLERSLPR